MTTKEATRAATGRGWAYIGAGLGGAVSIAANVAHSYVPPAGVPANWAPQGGAVVGAIFWPVALFVAVEILARVAWPSGRRWTALRFAGLLPVALVAAFVSYKHLAGLLAFYGEDGITAMLGPLAVDGLMVMATGALLATATRRPTTAVTPETVSATATVSTSNRVADATGAPAKRVTRKPISAERVAKVAAKMPDATAAQIAAKADVSESTARRHLAALAATVASPSAPVPAEMPTLIAA